MCGCISENQWLFYVCVCEREKVRVWDSVCLWISWRKQPPSLSLSHTRTHTHIATDSPRYIHTDLEIAVQSACVWESACLRIWREQPPTLSLSYTHTHTYMYIATDSLKYIHTDLEIAIQSACVKEGVWLWVSWRKSPTLSLSLSLSLSLFLSLSLTHTPILWGPSTRETRESWDRYTTRWPTRSARRWKRGRCCFGCVCVYRVLECILSSTTWCHTRIFASYLPVDHRAPRNDPQVNLCVCIGCQNVLHLLLHVAIYFSRTLRTCIYIYIYIYIPYVLIHLLSHPTYL